MTVLSFDLSYILAIYKTQLIKGSLSDWWKSYYISLTMYNYLFFFYF